MTRVEDNLSVLKRPEWRARMMRKIRSDVKAMARESVMNALSASWASQGLTANVNPGLANPWRMMGIHHFSREPPLILGRVY